MAEVRADSVHFENAWEIAQYCTRAQSYHALQNFGGSESGLSPFWKCVGNCTASHTYAKLSMLCKTLAEAQADSVRRLKRIQRFFQNFLSASKVHVGHIEGFQLIVKLLRLRERGDGAVQMQPDACAPLLKGTFIAEKRTLRNTRRKIEGLL